MSTQVATADHPVSHARRRRSGVSARSHRRSPVRKVGRKPVCVYCHGRIDRDTRGWFWHRPGERDDEPSFAGDVCCLPWLADMRTPPSAYDRAAGLDN